MTSLFKKNGRVGKEDRGKRVRYKATFKKREKGEKLGKGKKKKEGRPYGCFLYDGPLIKGNRGFSERRMFRGTDHSTLLEQKQNKNHKRYLSMHGCSFVPRR